MIQRIDGHSDAVIGYSALWEIVGSNLGRSVTGGDHGFAFAGFFGICFLFFKFDCVFESFLFKERLIAASIFYVKFSIDKTLNLEIVTIFLPL